MMVTYAVDYTLLKTLRVSRTLSIWHTTLLAANAVDIRGYTVFVTSSEYALYVTLDAGTADFADFEASLKVLSTEVGGLSEAVARSLAAWERGLSGLKAMTLVNVPPSASNLRKSWQVTCPPATTTFLDLLIAGDLVGPQGMCYIAGGEYKCRTEAAEGSALWFQMVDRDDTLGYFVYYGLQRTRMVLSGATGPITVGETVTGTTSYQTARVLRVVDADHVEITYADGPFEDAETVTFSGGSTATCVDWIEGDVLPLANSVKDEWLEGREEAIIRPGDSRALIQGLYFRCRAYNASTTATLRIKITLEVGIE